MLPSSGVALGFDSRAASRTGLKSAVAASLAIGSLSLGLIVTVTVLSIKVVAAMPLPL